MPNLKHLYYYHVFTQELSTVKAAKKLKITSPALSNQLKQFEAFLGIRLTQRVGNKVVITEQGKMVQHYADRMFLFYDDLKIKLSSNQDLSNPKFRVGICQNLGAQFSFDLLSLIEKSNLSSSKIVQITFDSSEKLFEGFEKGEFNLVMGAIVSGSSEEHKLVSKPLDFPVRLFAPLTLFEGANPSRKLSVAMNVEQIIKIANSKKISLVLPKGSSALRDETDKFLSQSKIRPLRIIECNSSSGIVQLIERGFAMGFVPTPCLLDFKSAQKLVVLGPTDGYWSHGIKVLIQKHEVENTLKNSKLSQILAIPSTDHLT